MPTRKQRKRRQKDRRHEWEEVLVYPDGREIPAEEADEDELPRRPPRREPRTRAARAEPAKRSARRGREVQPASWRRVFKRTLIFAPLMYVFILLTQTDASRVGQVLFTLQLLLIFIPFSYVMDVVTYRIWKRRADKAENGPSKRR